MMLTITALPQPVIARVQGTAAAAGCQLVAQCDLAVASEAAKFATPGVTWGFFCSTPGRRGRPQHARASARWRCCSPASSSTRARRWNGAWSTGSSRQHDLTKRDAEAGQADRREAAGDRRGRQARLLPADGSRRGEGLRAREPGHLVELRARRRAAPAWTPSSTSARRRSSEWLYHAGAAEGAVGRRNHSRNRGLTKEFKGFVAVNDVSPARCGAAPSTR